MTENPAMKMVFKTGMVSKNVIISVWFSKIVTSADQKYIKYICDVTFGWIGIIKIGYFPNTVTRWMKERR